MSQKNFTDHGVPEGSFEGLRAMTTQPYTEVNVKTGSQFSSSSYFTNLTAGEFLDAIVITGDKPIAIKAQFLEIKEGGDVLIDWYKDPVYSGGVDLSSGVFNQSDINPNPAIASLLGVIPTDAGAGNYAPLDASKPVVTDVGTKIQPTLAVLGVTGQGSSSASRESVIGLEHNLAPNSVYLFRRTIIESTDAIFGFSTWYEGDLDLPR